MPKKAGHAICQDRVALMDAWAQASDEYAIAVSELRSRLGIMPKAEYDQRWRELERLRLKAEMAKSDFERHRAEHGC